MSNSLSILSQNNSVSIHVLVERGELVGFPFLLGVEDGVDFGAEVAAQHDEGITHVVVVVLGERVLVQQDKDVPVGVAAGIATSPRAIQYRFAAVGDSAAGDILDFVNYQFVCFHNLGVFRGCRWCNSAS